MYFGEASNTGFGVAQDPELLKQDRSDEFTAGSIPSTEKKPTSLDIFWSGYENFQSLDAINARQLAGETAIDKLNDRIKTTLGVNLENPHRTKGLVSREQAKRGKPGDAWSFYQERLRELATKHPEHKAWLKAEQTDRSRAYEQGRKSEEKLMRQLQQNDSWLGYGASFAGGLAGMIRDPLNLAATPLGYNNARLGLIGILRTAAKNAGVNMAIEAAQQPFVQDYRSRAGVGSGLDHAALNVAMAGLFGFGLDASGRIISRGVHRVAGQEPQLDSKGYIQGWVPEGKAIDPELMARVQDGDIEAVKEIAKRAGVDKDPIFQQAVRHAEIDEDLNNRIQIEGIDDGEKLSMFIQAMRSVDDDVEPPPRIPDSPSPEIGMVRKSLEASNERELLDQMPDTKASVEQWRAFQAKISDERLQGLIERHVEEIKTLRGELRNLKARINNPSTSSTDVAKIFKDKPAVMSRVLPSSSQRLQAARNLSRLPDEVFGDVERGDLLPRAGAMIGELVEDTGRHKEIAEAVKSAGAETADDVRRVIGDELQRGQEFNAQKTILGVRDGADTTPPRLQDQPGGAETQARIKELQSELGAGRTFDDAVDAFREAVEKVKPLLPKGVKIRAHMDSSKPFGEFEDDLIQISLLALDPARYLRHEAIHALKKAGLFRETEWSLLLDVAERRGVLKAREGEGKPSLEEQYREAYDGYQNIEEIIKQEAVANLLEKHRDGMRYGNAADGILGRASGFIDRLRNALRGRGFQTADDVFDRLMSGEVANRARTEHVSRARRRVGKLKSDLKVRETFVDPQSGEKMSVTVVEALIDMWSFVRETRRANKPESLASFIKREFGGLVNEMGDIRNIIGDAKQRPAFMNKHGGKLDDVALSAWQAGYIRTNERPSIPELLNAIDEDINGGGVYRMDDDALLDDIRIADEMEQDLDEYGIAGLKSEKAVREYFEETREGGAEGRSPDSIRKEIESLESSIKDQPYYSARGDNEIVAPGDWEMVSSNPKAFETFDRTLQDIDAEMPAAIRGIPKYVMTDAIGDEGMVSVTFRRVGSSDTFGVRISSDQFVEVRAFHLDGQIFFLNPTLANGLRGHLRGQVWHEGIHALFRSASDERTQGLLARLAGHAEDLQIMQRDFREFSRSISAANWEDAPPNVTLERVYDYLYSGEHYKDVKDALMVEESVTHMMELRAHGHLTDDVELAAVKDVIDELFGDVPFKSIVDEIKPANADSSRLLASIRDVGDLSAWMDFTDQLGNDTFQIKDKAGQPYDVTQEAGGGSMTFMVRDGDTIVGNLYVRTMGNEVSVSNIVVQDAYQRRGIATAMYDRINEIIEPSGHKLAPSPDANMLNDGKAFWANRNFDSKQLPPPIPAGGLKPNDLGFFSKAVKVAKGLKQAKGTPEQMLAQLKKGGAKPAEIEATGLDDFLEGQKSVTRDGIVSFLELQRTPVREARYVQDTRDVSKPFQRVVHRDDFGGATSEDVYPDLPGVSGETKYSSYSVDPSNPTYRETVLHLPSNDKKRFKDVVEAAEEAKRIIRQAGKDPDEDWGYINPEDYIELAVSDFGMERPIIPNLGWTGQRIDTDFRQGHFDDVPNAIAHLRTSVQPDADGKPNFVINELQGDWGQNIRDQQRLEATQDLFPAVGDYKALDKDQKAAVRKAIKDNPDKYKGVRDEAKIADLKSAKDESAAKIRALETSDAMTSDEKRAVLRGAIEVEDMTPAQLDYADELRTFGLRESELTTAQSSSVVGHPLVNTDQWMTTGLRRALRQAVEADADYIAIASGETVDSFGMGAPRAGTLHFYDVKYPQELRKIIKKIDPEAAQIEKVGILKAHDADDAGKHFQRFIGVEADRIEVWKEDGEWLLSVDGEDIQTFATEAEAIKSGQSRIETPSFTRFPITSKVRAAVMGEGQPLFALSSQSRTPTLQSEHGSKLRRFASAKAIKESQLDVDTSTLALEGQNVELDVTTVDGPASVSVPADVALQTIDRKLKSISSLIKCMS